MKEIEIIEQIRKEIKTKDKSVIYGIGDDCAVIEYKNNEYLLLTTDSIVENIHFEKGKATYYQIGRKAIGVNLSDIAAMGGIPLYCLVSLGLPEGEKKIIDELIKGIKFFQKKFKFEVIGGNITKSEIFFIDVFMVGKVEKKYLKLRKGAKPGDLIYITGTIGGSQIKKHLNFIPRINEASYLVKNFPVSSMMDISDGISSDLIKLAKENNCGFEIYFEKLPISNDAKKISKSEEEMFFHALNDGEDYELVFTVPPEYKEKLPDKIEKTKITWIGKITREKKYAGIWKNKKINISPAGFDHFK